MNNYKVGQIYKVGISKMLDDIDDLIEITKVDGLSIGYKNVCPTSENYRKENTFHKTSALDKELRLVYNPYKLETEKNPNIEITIKINKTETIATLEIDGVHKETIDAEGFETEDFLYSVVDVFVDRINNPVSLYNGKVVCIDPCDCEDMYTLGKIYEFKDGRILDDDGCVVPPIDEEDIADFVEWQEFSSAKWVEVVE